MNLVIQKDAFEKEAQPDTVHNFSAGSASGEQKRQQQEARLLHHPKVHFESFVQRMSQKISAVTLLVPTCDEGIAFCVNKLGFALPEDTKLSETKRWVRVAPSSGQ